jgi:quinol-cytochrome oxidoreductase complex cytochrome b subunit
MQQLRTGVGFGQLVRNVHRWSAHLMVLVVLVHLARVFFAGAYKRPRQFNWVLGVGLLVLTLAFSFTGYLLPWDQLSYWAVTVGTNLVNYVPSWAGSSATCCWAAPRSARRPCCASTPCTCSCSPPP